MIDKYTKDRDKYIEIKTENNEKYENRNDDYSKNKNNQKLNTIESNSNSNKTIIDINKKIESYRSKSRDNGKNIIRNFKEKFSNKNILPPLDIHKKQN